MHVTYLLKQFKLYYLSLYHTPIQCFQDELAHFATAISYACKMFMNSAPVALE
jgi:hypothetical protein